MSTVITDTHVTVQQAASLIGVTHGRVRQLLLSGEMKGEQIPEQPNGRWMILRSEVARFAEQQPKTGRPRSGKGR